VVSTPIPPAAGKGREVRYYTYTQLVKLPILTQQSLQDNSVCSVLIGKVGSAERCLTYVTRHVIKQADCCISGISSIRPPLPQQSGALRVSGELRWVLSQGRAHGFSADRDLFRSGVGFSAVYADERAETHSWLRRNYS